ncbi:MAG: type II toxin-antitoxin system VapC family toxin, partial [Cyanobacteria bacterium K_DeepCast_35m_m1_288]|nr:type II toxin-antitoxin system VapC family toxin [Cyanobacteria bacterium K_DeepCast_35m_m1_288]
MRVLVQDDPEQARAAMDLLHRAELVAVPLPVLCELVWVLRR